MTTHAAHTRQRFDDLPPAQQAGMLCGGRPFQTFAAERSGFPGGRFTASAAAEFLRHECGVTSRRELNSNPAAAHRFQTLRTDFDAWRGKIATQRLGQTR